MKHSKIKQGSPPPELISNGEPLLVSTDQCPLCLSFFFCCFSSNIRSASDTYPKRFLKIHCQFVAYFAHDNPSLKDIDEQRMDNPEGQVTYPVNTGRPGYLPALACLIAHVAFLSLLLVFLLRLEKLSRKLPFLLERESLIKLFCFCFILMIVDCNTGRFVRDCIYANLPVSLQSPRCCFSSNSNLLKTNLI